jgi:hypothetical protein
MVRSVKLDWFFSAAAEIEKRLGCSRKEARTRLRQAFIDEELAPRKAPYEESRGFITFLPVEQWSSIAPSEWRKREVDYDDRDADGCEVMVMIHEKTFREWLDQQGHLTGKRVSKRKAPKLAQAQRAIGAIWPKDIPTEVADAQIIIRVQDWIKEDCKRQKLANLIISRDTILRAAGRKT